MATTQNVTVENKKPGIRIVKISRPKALNAINTATLEELKIVLQEAENDKKVRLVIFTGDGDTAFIAGADIKEMLGKSSIQGAHFAQLGHSVALLLEQMKKPTIAAVNGFALGGGTEMAIACDFILASDTAIFGQPEVGLGITPGFGATIRLAKFVGYPMAKELIYSGRKVKADEALRLGLVNHVYPRATFWSSVLELAEQISKNSMSAVATSKKLINEFSESKGLHYKVDAEVQDFASLFGSPDQKEGMLAFVEKRKPAFEGL